MQNRTEDFLKEGKQAAITPKIKEAAVSINGEGLTFVANVLEWMDEHLQKRKYTQKLFRKRTADEIIKSGFSTGCTDDALVFIALTRAGGIPAKYVEAIETKWLEKDGERITGHVFAEIFVNNKWYLVDPAGREISVKPVPDRNQYVVFAKGLDSWDIGIKSYEDLKEEFLSFRQTYAKQSK